MKHLIGALMILMAVSLLTCCSRTMSDMALINDFEEDSDLDRLGWKCHTLYALSTGHATHGKGCLLVSMFPPSVYPGVSFRGYVRDWRAYQRLSMDIYNPEDQGELNMTVRIDDKADSPEYQDRVNHRIVLQPGMNHVHLPMDELVTPSGRHLDLSHIHALMMFMVNPAQKTILYVDHVRLE